MNLQMIMILSMNELQNERTGVDLDNIGRRIVRKGKNVADEVRHKLPVGRKNV